MGAENTPSSTHVLSSRPWKACYRHEDGDLIELFYVPALACAVRYDRSTGFFSANALALAARGVHGLVMNRGKMRLLVGCTLDNDEIEAIERGYDLRQKVQEKLAQIDLTPPNEKVRQGLELLAWMIAAGHLDVKIAVPVDSKGKPVKLGGIYHEKVGVLEDTAGNVLSFSGSINETEAGWIHNRESFHVHCTWLGGRENEHVQIEVDAFKKLWEDQAHSTRVYEFPEAARQKLLAFLPRDDHFITPPKPPKRPAVEEPGFKLTPSEARRIVWTFIRLAPRLWNGSRVGQATSAVEPWPHQVRIFDRFLKRWPNQLLIADEVGLGKCISAGLILRQLWLAGRAGRILVMVPKAVLPQWQNELYEKFNLNVPAYDGGKLVRRPVHGLPGPWEKSVGRTTWHREPFVMCSSQLMRRRDRVDELLAAEDWDLVVLDESHHARRRSAGNPKDERPNALLKLMRQVRPKTKALLLLTATPMQVHPVEVYDLLDLLGLPPKWKRSAQDFCRYFELAAGNPGETDMRFLAEMFRDMEGAFGQVQESELERFSPGLSRVARQRILKGLRDKSGIPLKKLGGEDRAACLRLLQRVSPIRHLMARQTRDLLRKYHEQGLLKQSVPRRRVIDVPVEMTPAEQNLYEAVEDYISETYNKAAPDKRTAIGFVMTIYRTRLASSFRALQQTLNDRLARLREGAGAEAGSERREMEWEEDAAADELSREEVMDSAEADELSDQALGAEEASEIDRLLRMIARVGANTKARKLVEKLKDAFADGYDSAIVFTQYTDTMEFLKEHLAAELPGLPIGTYSGPGAERRDAGGTWVSVPKEQIKRDLKAKRIRLLVATDSASEGLNLQACGVLANFDLPWNPMKVEQRIGRIDRIGQQRPEVRILNFVYERTVEADIYFALRRRIHLFEGVVGKLQPILSRLPQRFEQVVLEPKERREATRERVLADLEQMAQEAEQATFDIDVAAEEAFVAPDLPEPAMTLAELDAALNRKDARPAALDWKPLDPGSYAVSMPGMHEPARGTTSAEVFEDHPESMVFLSPGGKLFEEIAALATSDAEQSEGDTGVCWTTPATDAEGSRFLFRTGHGVQAVARLGDLLGLLPQAEAGPLPEEWRGKGARLVA
jgi:hypothetical protein